MVTRWRRSVLAVTLIILTGICTYWNSISGPFVWDDQTAIVTNPTIRRVWDSWSPPRETPVAGRPVVNVSFALNYAAGELQVTGYHVVNIAVHLVCALLLYGIVRRTLGREPHASATRRSPDAIALIAAMLWLLHPLQSEAVDYVTERTESMMGLFFFLTLYCAIRASRSVAHRGWWESAAIVSCVLGMASKESMVTAPLIVVVYDRVFQFNSFRDALRARSRLYGGLMASWLVLGTLIWQAARSTVSLEGAVGPWTYFLNQLQLQTRYLWLAVWPRALVLDYGLPRMLSLRDVMPAAAVIILLLLATIVAFARWPRIGVLGAMFFLTLAPSSTVVPILTEVGAERRMYVPFAALAVLLVVIGCELLDRVIVRHSEHARALVVGATTLTMVVLAALGARTAYRNAEYASPLTLWRTVVERYPHGRARYAHAQELIAVGRLDEAIAELRQAVRDFPDARYSLATELLATGHVAEASAELREVIRRQPSRPDAVFARLLLGKTLIDEGKLDEAASQFQAVLAASPSHERARRGLADVVAAHRDFAARYLIQQDASQAAVHAAAAVRLSPQDGFAHNLLGVALALQGQVQPAIDQFQEALRINPEDQQARNNLARALSLSQPNSRPQ